MTAQAIDEAHMRRCLELARRGEGKSSPNPMVGCVIVDARGQVIAEGWHRGPGTRHAEADALARLADQRAPGATVYCNLEPCHHKRNRRTHPCSLALERAGIARLVMGIGDPIRSHAGGARYLEKRGVVVTRKVLRAECAELNRAFFTWARCGRPLMVLKAAVSLDGKVATRTGESQWITGVAARRHGHGVRARLDAIMVGAGTVLADDPRLTARTRGARDPIRVVVDSRLRTPEAARLLPANSDSRARVIIATTITTTEGAASSRAKRLERAGAEVWRMPADHASGRVSLEHLLDALARAEVTSVLVEGGPALSGALLERDLVDDVLLYIAPLIIGGQDSLSWAGGHGVAELANAPRFRLMGPGQTLGQDLLLHYRRARRAKR